MSKRVALQLAALAATTTTPRIVRAIAKAAHGPEDQQLEQLHQAQQHCRDLLSKFEVVEAELTRTAPPQAALG